MNLRSDNTTTSRHVPPSGRAKYDQWSHLVGLQGSESVDDSSSSSAVHALVESPTGIGDRDGRALEFPDLVGQARVALPNLETDVVVRACSSVRRERPKPSLVTTGA